MLEEQRRKVFDAHKTQAQHIKDVAEGLIEAYRTANLESRTDRDQSHNSSYPVSYLQEVKIQIPRPLQAADPPPLGSNASVGSGTAPLSAGSSAVAASSEGGKG